MPCVVDIKQNEMTNHFETLLCKACKLLTVKQIKELKNANSGIVDGIDWYVQHLWLDCTHNDDIFNFDNNENEKLIAINELKRLGYTIKKNEDGSEELLTIVYPY